jgi:hypothetical protein
VKGSYGFLWGQSGDKHCSKAEHLPVRRAYDSRADLRFE